MSKKMFFKNLGNPLNKNVIGAYKFENNGDDSKNGYNGIVGSAVTFSSGVDGNKANFVGNTNSYIQVPYNGAFDFTDGTNDLPFSVSFFQNYISNTGAFAFMVGKGNINNASDFSWCVYIWQGTINLFLLDKINNNFLIGRMNFTSTPNQKITFTYNGNKNVNGIKGYINGVAQFTYTAGTVTSYNGIANKTHPLSIGATNIFNSNLIGSLDELYIFNKELNQSEITFLQTNYYPF